MGFYGNVSNITRSTFQFDKIYPNRTIMDESAENDNIYLGRYVLVEYDTSIDFDAFQRIYPGQSDKTAFYTTKNSNKEEDKVKGENGKYYFTADEDISQSSITYINVVLYKYIDEKFKVVREIDNPEQIDSYTTNYNIDIDKYGYGRGYDSTVWMKTYSGEKIKYVMIAELNTVVPTFAVTADAPTDNPIQPHFDGDSTNVYYNLHLQSPWGMRIKEAIDVPSDETTVWHSTNIDINNIENDKYPNIHDISIVTSEDTKNAAIYYNKDGFNPARTNKITNMNDTISLTNAKSGRYYNDHKGSSKQQDDIKELSIILPSLGNTVSDMWDIVYGKGNPQNNNYRNRDIYWGSDEGNRMVTLDEDGYHFNSESAESMAGIINSTHDLMGMIIETEDQMSAGDKNDILIASEDEIDGFLKIDPNNKYKYENGLAAGNEGQIYYSGTTNNFYIKQLSYDYTKISSPDELNTDNQYIPVTLSNWSPDTYYYVVAKNGDKIIQYNKDISQKATINRDYHKLELTKNTVIKFEKNKYYTPANVGGVEKYALVSEIGEGNTALQNNALYTITSTKATTPGKIEFYIANKYYYIENGTLLLDTNDTLTSARKYFTASIDTEKSTITLNPITLINFTTSNPIYYRKENGSYIRLTSAEDNKWVTYKLSTTKQTASAFYYSVNNPWWYKSNDIKLIKMDKTDYDGTYELYTITDQTTTDKNLKHKFYIPGYYYYDNGSSKILDYNISKTSGRQYYEYAGYYIMADTESRCNIGAPWVYSAKEAKIPDGVTIGTRSIKYKWTKLDGFARNLNTIHGLIISINNILKANDNLTRDTQTVQGAINTLNDIINKFEKIFPGQILFVNNYGQVVSSNVQNNRWVKNDIDGTFNNQSVEFIHGYRDNTKYSASKDENSINDKMFFADIGSNEYNADKDFDSTSTFNFNTASTTNDKNNLIIYTPVIDATGHVVGRHQKTMTLPYGFKTVSISNSNAATSLTNISTSSIVADSTQDTMTISTGNKWLGISSNANNDIITIAHKVSEIDTTEAASSNLNTNSDDDIDIPDISYDEAGHIISQKSHKYTLPYGFKSITTSYSSSNATVASNTGSAVATNTQDTLTFSAGNKWLKIGTKDNNIIFGHKLSTPTNSTTTSDLTSTSTTNFELKTYDFDEAGHMTKITTNTVTVPNNFGKITVGDITTTASGSQDTVTFTGDNHITISLSEKTITVSHNAAQTATNTTITTAQSSSFGGTFNIPTISYDKNGHIKNVGVTTVSLPETSLALTGTGNVITSLAMTANTGAITGTKNNIGSLVLTGFTSQVSSTTPLLATETTINNAFAILEENLILATQTITSLEENLTSATQTIASLEQKIATLEQTVNNLITDNDDGSISITIPDKDGD